MPTYLALGDSMSIDDYTGVEGGGAVSQFARTLGDGWMLDDRTRDGCRMAGVPVDARGDLITLTIGGNDLLFERDRYLSEGLAGFARQHAELLDRIRTANPTAALIVCDVYTPAAPLNSLELEALALANALIRQNVAQAGAFFAPINATFRGREDELLCLGIEPTLAGASEIARLFREAYACITA